MLRARVVDQLSRVMSIKSRSTCVARLLRLRGFVSVRALDVIGKSLVLLSLLVFLVSIFVTPKFDYSDRFSIVQSSSFSLTSIAFFLMLSSVIVFICLRIPHETKKNETPDTSVISPFRTWVRTHAWSIAAILAFTVFVWRNVIFSSDIPGGADTIGFTSEIGFLAKSGGAFQIWENMNFGWIRHPTFTDLLSILDRFIANPILVIKVFVIGVFLLSAISIYFFMYYLSRSKTASLFSAIAFCANQFSIAMLASGHLNHMVAYALIPLTFYLYDRAIRDRKFVSVLVFAIVVGFNFLCRLDSIVFIAPFLGLWAFLYVLIPDGGERRRQVLVRVLRKTLLGCGLVFLLYSFVILPILFNVRAFYFYSTKGVQLSETLSNSLPLLQTFLGMPRGLGYLWWVSRVGWDIHPFLTVQEYRLTLFFLPALAFLGMLYYRRKRYALFFGLGALFSLFLAKGPYPPFGEVYNWLFNNIPLFDKFVAPYRWLRITDFCYAFLGGMAVNAILTKGTHFNIVFSFLDEPISKPMSMKQFSRAIPVLAILALLTGSWVAVSPGFVTWRIPQQEIKPHLWLAEQPGDFRVFPVPYQISMWQGEGPTRGKKGWFAQDLGYRGSLWSGKPVVASGNWFGSTDLTTFIRRQIFDGSTRDLMKILGIMNVKYVVIQGYNHTDPDMPDYPMGWQHRFFTEQRGLKLVHSNGNASVYENTFVVPHITGMSERMIVVGSRNAFISLASIEEFDFRNWLIEFSYDTKLMSQQPLGHLNESAMILFANTKPLDIKMVGVEDSTVVNTLNQEFLPEESGWIFSNKWAGKGLTDDFTFSATAYGNISFPIKVAASEEYEIWAYLLYGPDRGNLFVGVDDHFVSIQAFAPYYGFEWAKIGNIQLSKGQHKLTIVNNPNDWGTENDVLEIMLAPPSSLLSNYKEIEGTLQNSSAHIVYLIDASQLFKWETDTPERPGADVVPVWIADDNQSSNWRVGVSGTGSIGKPVISDDTYQKTRGINSLKVDVPEGQNATWYIFKEFTNDQDWSNMDYLSLDWYGLNTNRPFLVWFGNWSSRYQFEINEDWMGWKHLVFRLDKAMPRRGQVTPDLSRVKIFGIQMLDNSSCTRHLDAIKFDVYSKFHVVKRPLEATGGYFVETRADNETISLSFRILRSNTYSLALRAASYGDQSAEIGVRFGSGFEHKIVLPGNSRELKYFTIGPFNISAGTQLIQISTYGRLRLDQLLLYERSGNSSLNQLFAVTKTKSSIPYANAHLTVNSGKYFAHVVTDKPFFLFFAESYHPMWRAYVDGQNILSQSTYGGFNCFYLSKVGEYIVRIQFLGQLYVWYGSLVSLVTIILVSVYVSRKKVLMRLVSIRFASRAKK